MAELDVNEGVSAHQDGVPGEGQRCFTPIFPAPTNARTFVILRLLACIAGVLAKATGGACPPTRRRSATTGVYGHDHNGNDYLMREVLGGGSGGRWYADGEDTIHVVPDSRNIPVEFAEARWPFRVERLGRPWTAAGGQVPGRARVRQAHPDVAGRVLHVHRRPVDPGCWGVNGGRAGRPFVVTVNGVEMEGLVDGFPGKEGEIVRVRTTGGGGWGSPFEREPQRVATTCGDGKVSLDCGPARVRRGVVGRAGGRCGGNRGASGELSVPSEAFFDRGPGYPKLSGGSRTRMSISADRGCWGYFRHWI